MPTDCPCCAVKDAEIEQLELDLSNALGDSQDKDAENEKLQTLITELCDALEWWETHTSYEPPFAVELKKRAREATR